MLKKENRGGARKGAGRARKEPTTTLAYRVPVSKAKIINVEVKKLIAKHLK